jgi:hypothetical protein
MDRLSLGGNTIGLFLTGEPGQVRGAIRDSSISGNGTGVNVVCIAGGKADLDVESCLITNNDYGLFGQNLGGIEAGISISNCTISHNDTRAFDMVSPAFIVSRANNTIIGNGPSIPPGPPPTFPAQ